jgi:hypothetical protein
MNITDKFQQSNNIENASKLKKQYNRSWYVNKGYIVLKIKSLIKKYDIDIDMIPVCLDYRDKTEVELTSMLKNFQELIY